MAVRRSYRYWLAMSAVVASVDVARGEVTLDGSVGLAGTLAGPSVIIPAEVGRTVGFNLFHSFSKFDIAAGESVTFRGPPTIQNVLARVTSGSASNINGRLRCEIPGAGLYLINPAGVIFGPSAVLEVRGSFAVTSADFIRLGLDGRFDARDPSLSVLVTSAPSAFGFSGSAPGSIIVQNSGLGVPDGKSISIAGGDVRIIGGQLLAGSGAVNLVAGPTGDAILTTSEIGTTIELAQGAMPRNAVEISEGTDIDVSGQTPGRLTIRAASLKIAGAGASSGASAGAAQTSPPLAFDVHVTELLDIGPAGFFATGATGAGPAGDIRVRAGSVSIDRGEAQTFTGIGSQSTSSGAGGSIDIATDDLKIANSGGVFAFAGSGERGGSITVHASNLELANGGQIVAQARGAAGGGDVVLDIDGPVMLDGARAAIVSDTSSGSSGTGGKIDLFATNLKVADTAFISATTNGAGAGGAINLNVDGDIDLDGAGKIDFTGVGANTQPGSGAAAGQGGSVTIAARSMNIREGAGVATKTFGGQNGGQMQITLTDALIIDARESGQQTGLNAEATGAAANGGSIAVHANRVELRRGQITASAVADGGSIEITAPDAVHLFSSEIVAEAGGNGGNVSIDPRSVILDRSRISANAVAGNGGNIRIRSQAFLPSADPQTVVSASSELGLVGNIEINAPDTEIAGSLVKLSGTLAAAGATLPALCPMNAEGTVSSFVMTGRGGAPLSPGGWSASLNLIEPGSHSEDGDLRSPAK